MSKIKYSIVSLLLLTSCEFYTGPIAQYDCPKELLNSSETVMKQAKEAFNSMEKICQQQQSK